MVSVATAPRKANSEDLTVSYTQIASVPIGARQNMMRDATLADIMSRELTPAERAALFPKAYAQSILSNTGSSDTPKTREIKPSEEGVINQKLPGGITERFPDILSGTPRRKTATPLPYNNQNVQEPQVAKRASGREVTGNYTDREKAVLSMISKREGASDPNIIFGDKSGQPGTGKYSQALGLDKRPLTDMSINEVLAMQKKLTAMTAADGVANGVGTSAVGSGQFVRGTLIGNLKKLGIPEDQWDKVKYDEDLQHKLTLQNFKDNVGDPNGNPHEWNMQALGDQWESLKFDPLNEHEIADLAAKSTESPQTATAMDMASWAKQYNAGDLAPTADNVKKYEDFKRQTATPVETVKDTSVLKPIDNPLKYMEDRNPRGAKLDKVDPVLLKSYSEAAQQYEAAHPDQRVEVFGGSSGVRESGSTHNHGIQSSGYGGAIDMVIVDKKTGQQLTNYHTPYPGQVGSVGEQAPKYAELHSYARLAQEHYFPGSNPITFGGKFVNDNPMDTMHGDITHADKKGGGFSFEEGFTADQMKRWGIEKNVALGDRKQQQALADQIYGNVDSSGNYASRIVPKQSGDLTTFAAAKVDNAPLVADAGAAVEPLIQPQQLVPEPQTALNTATAPSVPEPTHTAAADPTNILPNPAPEVKTAEVPSVVADATQQVAASSQQVEGSKSTDSVKMSTASLPQDTTPPLPVPVGGDTTPSAQKALINKSKFVDDDKLFGP